MVAAQRLSLPLGDHMTGGAGPGGDDSVMVQMVVPGKQGDKHVPGVEVEEDFQPEPWFDERDQQ